MLGINNVVKKFGTNTVLHIPSLHLTDGMYWIQGANGSGKTTFLKMTGGLLPFEGDIVVNNISLKKKPLLYRQQVSWSEAEPMFPFFITGLDLIALYKHIRKASQQEADTLIALFNLNEYAGNPIGTYSAGMAKKLSLLLSFLGKSSLILLDEPLITLDADTVTTVCNLIVETNRTKGTSFLISSHQEIDARLLSFNLSFIVQNKTITAV